VQVVHGKPKILRNLTFDEIAVGDTASIERVLRYEDIQLFAALSGDCNPQYIDPDFAASSRFHELIAPGGWGAALISAVLGTYLPGPGTVYLGQTLNFLAPVRIGDALTIRVNVTAKDDDTKQISLACSCINQHHVTVIDGEFRVQALVTKLEYRSKALPELVFKTGGSLHELLGRADGLGKIRVAVVHPCDAISLKAALHARTAGLIDPVLIAPRKKLEWIAAENGLDLTGISIEEVAHSHAAAERAVSLAAKGEVQALMKGSLHTGELISAMLVSEAGLRTERRLSHCFLVQAPAYPRPFIITDAAINIAPTLNDKADIVRNAIDLAHAIGIAEPRVAILAAVETINPDMPATVDAAAICKMADRGQIMGAIIDGPLAFDNAISIEAAKIKGIVSKVAGRADVLVVPDLESGNMLVKQLEYLGNAAIAGIVLGARVPVILTSRSDSLATRIESCALAILMIKSSQPPRFQDGK